MNIATNKILILGAGGVGMEIAEFVETISVHSKKDIRVVGFLDDFIEERELMGYPVFGALNLYSKFVDCAFISSIGSATNTKLRELIANRIPVEKERWASVLHPNSVVSKTALIEPGVVVYPGCKIGSNVTIGFNSLMAYNSTVGHESQLGSHVVLASGVNISGDVEIGQATYIGPGSVVAYGINIGDDCMIGVGSVVDSNVSKNTRLIQKSRDFKLPNGEK
jgi:sugar O-acyltransferase (sialic acid O-acetyltransferase NeuD family)